MKRNYFFEATTIAIRRLNRAMDDFASALIAIKNMRCHVKGVLSECGTFSESSFESRYGCQSEVNWKNYKNVFSVQPFSQQVQSFTWYLLISTCMVFEGWLAEMKKAKFISGKMEGLLQCSGATSVISRYVARHKSSLMAGHFYPVYCQGKKYCFSLMEGLIVCYQLFKHMRNCAVHGNGIANSSCVKAYCDFCRRCSTASLGVSELPNVDSIVVGAELCPTFRGVFGFTDIVIRMLVSYDAELLCAQAAEAYFVARYEKANSKTEILSAKPARLARQFSNNVRKSGFRPPQQISQLKDYFADRGYRYL